MHLHSEEGDAKLDLLQNWNFSNRMMEDIFNNSNINIQERTAKRKAEKLFVQVVHISENNVKC